MAGKYIDPVTGAPRYTQSYLIPISDLTLDERRSIRANVDELLLDLVLEHLKFRSRVEDLLVRDTLTNFDLGITDVGAVITDAWLIPGAGVVGTELQYFSAVIAQDHALATWGIENENAVGNISRVRLTQGPGSAQTRGEYQVESLYTRLEPVGYLSEAIPFSRGETYRAMVMPRLAFPVFSERLHLMSRTVEPIGYIISAPSV